MASRTVKMDFLLVTLAPCWVRGTRKTPHPSSLRPTTASGSGKHQRDILPSSQMCPSLCETLPVKRQSKCFSSVRCQNLGKVQHSTAQGGLEREMGPATMVSTQPANPICDSVRPRLLGASQQRSVTAVSVLWQAGWCLVTPQWLSPPWAACAVEMGVSAPPTVIRAPEITTLPVSNQSQGISSSHIKRNQREGERDHKQKKLQYSWTG